MIKHISYEDKESLYNNEKYLRKNKVTSLDLNEIKDVVNENANELSNSQTSIVTINQTIEEIKSKNTTQDNNIQELRDKNDSQDLAIGNKVEKVDGKGLSTNDYTTQEKTKLAGLNNYDDTAIKEDISKVEAIAKGRATGYVFDTKADMDAWLKVQANKEKLVLGDNLYIRATDVPDYWWDGTSAQQLETQKVDLSGFVKDTDIVITNKELLANKVTTISEESTDTQYPSAKAVYEYIQSLDGNEVDY